MNDPSPLKDPNHPMWFIEDQVVMAWLLKLAISLISEPIQLITPTKAIWDKWASMYGYESNISWIVEVCEQLIKAKWSGCRLQNYYVNIHGLLS